MYKEILFIQNKEKVNKNESTFCIKEINFKKEIFKIFNGNNKIKKNLTRDVLQLRFE